MTREELIRFNELADVAIEAELKLNQARHELKAGKEQSAKTHIEQAYSLCSRLKGELGGFGY